MKACRSVTTFSRGNLERTTTVLLRVCLAETRFKLTSFLKSIHMHQNTKMVPPAKNPLRRKNCAAVVRLLRRSGGKGRDTHPAEPSSQAMGIKSRRGVERGAPELCTAAGGEWVTGSRSGWSVAVMAAQWCQGRDGVGLHRVRPSCCWKTASRGLSVLPHGIRVLPACCGGPWWSPWPAGDRSSRIPDRF